MGNPSTVVGCKTGMPIGSPDGSNHLEGWEGLHEEDEIDRPIFSPLNQQFLLRGSRLCLKAKTRTPILTHDVQNVVSYLGGGDGALFGVRLQYLQHGLQLVQSAVLTLLTDELTAHRLENTRKLTTVSFPAPSPPPPTPNLCLC